MPLPAASCLPSRMQMASLVIWAEAAWSWCACRAERCGSPCPCRLACCEYPKFVAREMAGWSGTSRSCFKNVDGTRPHATCPFISSADHGVLLRGWTCISRAFRFRSFRSEEHTSELQSLMRISYAVFCLKKKNVKTHTQSDDEYTVRLTMIYNA